MASKQNKPPAGSSLDDFLIEHNIFDQCEHDSIKRVLCLQIERAMADQNLTKSTVAERMGTSRSALGRLLDPTNTSVTLETLKRVADATGLRLLVRLVTDEKRSGSGQQD
jgi:antitoxin HicB